MKKVTKSILILLLFAGSIFACAMVEEKHEEQENKNEKNQNLSTKTITSVSGYEQIEGTIQLFGTPEKEIVINLRSITSSTANDLENKVLILDREVDSENIPSVLNGVSATLYVWNSGVVVETESNGNFYLALSDQEEDVFSQLPSSVTDNIDDEFTGFGLTKINWDYTDLISLLGDHSSIFLINGGSPRCDGHTECTSGGTGSTSCSESNSTSSCTVTCTGNYYACCVNVSCFCCTKDHSIFKANDEDGNN